LRTADLVDVHSAVKPISERQFMAQVTRLANLLGWKTYHTHDSRRSEAGSPDLVLVRRPRLIFAELKSERGKATDEQRAWLGELRECGQSVYLWRPSDWREIERVLR
jgi:hypothetical protein